MPVKYIGSGKEYIYGVPMRDMTDEEWAALPEDGRKIAEASGLFEGFPAVDDDTQPVIEPDWETDEE